MSIFMVMILFIAVVFFLIARFRGGDRPTTPTQASPGPRVTAAAAAVQLPSPTFRVIALGGSGAGNE
ncbi:MAG: hypothetical protein ACRDRK_10095 [Pseudonocardia sp.]